MISFSSNLSNSSGKIETCCSLLCGCLKIISCNKIYKNIKNNQDMKNQWEVRGDIFLFISASITYLLSGLLVGWHDSKTWLVFAAMLIAFGKWRFTTMSRDTEGWYSDKKFKKIKNSSEELEILVHEKKKEKMLIDLYKEEAREYQKLLEEKKPLNLNTCKENINLKFENETLKNFKVSLEEELKITKDSLEKKKIEYLQQGELYTTFKAKLQNLTQQNLKVEKIEEIIQEIDQKFLAFAQEN